MELSSGLHPSRTIASNESRQSVHRPTFMYAASSALQDAAVQGLHFPQLMQLGLECVHVSEPSLHRLIAGCPALKFLLILRSSGFHSLRINSLSLRKICIRTSGSTQPQFGELIIENAPRLESLIYLHKIWRIGDLQVSLPE